MGGVPIPTRGIHGGTLYMYVLCGILDCLVGTAEFRRMRRLNRGILDAVPVMGFISNDEQRLGYISPVFYLVTVNV